MQRPGKIRKQLKIPENFDIIAYITLGYVEEDNSLLSISHYKNIEQYSKHERKYGLSQVLCEESFSKTIGDCTEMKGKRGVTWIKYLYKLNMPFLRKIENKL